MIRRRLKETADSPIGRGSAPGLGKTAGSDAQWRSWAERRARLESFVEQVGTASLELVQVPARENVAAHEKGARQTREASPEKRTWTPRPPAAARTARRAAARTHRNTRRRARARVRERLGRARGRGARRRSPAREHARGRGARAPVGEHAARQVTSPRAAKCGAPRSVATSPSATPRCTAASSAPRRRRRRRVPRTAPHRPSPSSSAPTPSRAQTPRARTGSRAAAARTGRARAPRGSVEVAAREPPRARGASAPATGCGPATACAPRRGRAASVRRVHDVAPPLEPQAAHLGLAARRLLAHERRLDVERVHREEREARVRGHEQARVVLVAIALPHELDRRVARAELRRDAARVAAADARLGQHHSRL